MNKNVSVAVMIVVVVVVAFWPAMFMMVKNVKIIYWKIYTIAITAKPPKKYRNFNFLCQKSFKLFFCSLLKKLCERHWFSVKENFRDRTTTTTTNMNITSKFIHIKFLHEILLFEFFMSFHERILFIQYNYINFHIH